MSVAFGGLESPAVCQFRESLRRFPAEQVAGNRVA
jgi:hypothetical protein